MKNINLHVLILLIAGVLLQFVVHGSVMPLIVMCTLFFPTVAILSVCRLLKRYEFKAFLLSFSTGFVWTSISAAFRFTGDDFFQLKSDAYQFWAHSSNMNKNLSIDEILRVTDGSAGVYIWREFYRFFDTWNIPLDPYIGIYVNCIVVAITAIFLIKIIKTVYGDDSSRMLKAAYLHSFLGIYWIYGSIHVRDGFILLLTTLLVLFIVRAMKKMSLTRILMLLAYSVAWVLFFKYFRVEYKYIPIAAIGVGFAALSFSARNILSKSTIILIILFNLVFMALNYSQLTSGLEEDSNLEVGKQWNTGDSLGGKYVVNAPVPMRIVLGSFYVHAFPVPAWAGLLQFQSSYHFLKSCTAFYMLIVMPLVLAGAMKTIRNRRQKDNALLIFALGFYALFTLSVVMTSLEGRHLGVFASGLILLAVYPDGKNKRDKKSIKFWRVSWIGAVTVMHIGYFILKM